MSNVKKALVRHLRDSDRKPYATIAAVGVDRIGLAICSPKDSFNKNKGRELAIDRAGMSWSYRIPKIPNRIVTVETGVEGFESVCRFEDIVDSIIDDMRERAKKYFKTEAK